MFNSKNKVLTEINIPRPLIDLITAHEIHCVASCCGKDAFDFTPKAIAENKWTEEAVANIDMILARKQLDEFRASAKRCRGEPSNDRINIWWKNASEVDSWCDMIERLISSCESHLKTKVEKNVDPNS